MADWTHAFNFNFTVPNIPLKLLELAFKRYKLIRKGIIGKEKITIHFGMLNNRYTNNKWSGRPEKPKIILVMGITGNQSEAHCRIIKRHRKVVSGTSETRNGSSIWNRGLSECCLRGLVWIYFHPLFWTFTQAIHVFQFCKDSSQIILLMISPIVFQVCLSGTSGFLYPLPTTRQLPLTLPRSLELYSSEEKRRSVSRMNGYHSQKGKFN